MKSLLGIPGARVMIGLLIGKGLAAGATHVGAGLDVPFRHEDSPD